MITVILGILILAYGLFTIYLRVCKHSAGLGKLDKMKELYGERLGKTIHIISYTVLPIILGVTAFVLHFFFGVDIL